MYAHPRAPARVSNQVPDRALHGAAQGRRWQDDSRREGAALYPRQDARTSPARRLRLTLAEVGQEGALSGAGIHARAPHGLARSVRSTFQRVSRSDTFFHDKGNLSPQVPCKYAVIMKTRAVSFLSHLQMLGCKPNRLLCRLPASQ
eukprot:1917966-Pleurochrysis_carterae.AAC.2